MGWLAAFGRPAATAFARAIPVQELLHVFNTILHATPDSKRIARAPPLFAAKRKTFIKYKREADFSNCLAANIPVRLQIKAQDMPGGFRGLAKEMPLRSINLPCRHFGNRFLLASKPVEMISIADACLNQLLTRIKDICAASPNN